MNDIEYAKSLVDLQLADVKRWQGTDRTDLLEAALGRLDEATKRHEAAIAAESLRATERAQARKNKPAPRYYGPRIGNFSTHTTHFVNAWGETFCGRIVDFYFLSGEGRATCKTCQRAGDASMRGGVSAGGSPARRW